MNVRAMVNVNGREWCGNNVRNLMSRWMQVTDTRVDETDAPVNYRWENNKLVSVKEPADG